MLGAGAEVESWAWDRHILNLPSPPPSTDSSEGTLEGMVRGLRQGGVSLLGQPQPLTHEQWRSSFMRRNRDPQLNERVHRVRALQSTLKVSWGHWARQGAGLYAFGSGCWPTALGSVVELAKF